VSTAAVSHAISRPPETHENCRWSENAAPVSREPSPPLARATARSSAAGSPFLGDPRRAMRLSVNCRQPVAWVSIDGPIPRGGAPGRPGRPTTPRIWFTW
jgi:hypothetical protein